MTNNQQIITIVGYNNQQAANIIRGRLAINNQMETISAPKTWNNNSSWLRAFQKIEEKSQRQIIFAPGIFPMKHFV